MKTKTHLWTTARLGLLAVLLSASPVFADALQFNGLNQSVQAPDTSSLRLTNRLTVEAWIKRAGTGVQHSIVEKYGCSTGQGGYALRVAANDKLLFGTRDDCNNGSSVLGLTSISANVWTHVAGSWDGATLRVFVNGAPDGSLASTRNPKWGNTPLKIGERGSSGTPFNGQIDEVRLWNVARSAADISSTLSQCLTGNEANLAAYWRLDEGTGATAADQTANANTAALVNGPIWTTAAEPVSCGPTLKIVAVASAAAEPNQSGLINIARTGPTTASLTVSYSISGTAQNGVDYQTLSGTAQIPAGAASVDLAVTPIDDTIQEGSETVTLTLTANPAYKIDGANGSATVTIADDDFTPVVKIVVPDGLAAETGGDTGTFRIERAGSTALALTVNFTVKGSAIADLDYTNLGTSIEIPAGASSVDLTVWPIDDGLPGGIKSVSVLLGASASYVIGFPENATLQITDQPIPPVLSVVATTPQCSEGSANPGVFTITRTGPTASALEVLYSLGEEPVAINGLDYELIPFSATIPAGSASVDVRIVPLDDIEFEGPEAVEMTLDPNFTYLLATNHFATVMIQDNDLPPTVQILVTDGAASETGPDAGAFQVIRTGPTAAALTVNYNLAGTAANGSDYDALSGSVIIPAGSATAPIVVMPIDDTLIEGPETVTVFLAVDPNYVVGVTNSGTVTIADNDASPANAIQFDGVNDLAQAPDSASLRITGPMTVEAWIKRSVAGVQHSIVEKYGCTAPAGGYVLRVTASDKLMFGTRDDCNNGSSATGATSIPAGVWTHVAGVWDGVACKVYMNGVLDGTLPTTRNPKAGNTPLKIGERGNGGTPFNGLIDEVRVWNVARTSAQLSAGKGVCLTGGESGLAGYWRCNESSGALASDLSANHNNASLFNGAFFSASTAPVTCGGGGGGGGEAASELAMPLQPPVLGMVTLAGARWLTVTGAPGGTCTIQVSSDLQSWSELATLFNETGSFQYEDKMAGEAAARFYRIVQTP
jgi:hypothetical protein